MRSLNSFTPTIIYLYLILCFSQNLDTTTPCSGSNLINKFYNQLKHSTDRIKTLQQKTLSKTFASEYTIINTNFEKQKSVSKKAQIQSQTYKRLPQFRLQNMKTSIDSSVQARQTCKIIIQQSSQILKYHFTSINGQFLIFVSNKQQKTLEIFRINCQFLVRIDDLTLKIVIDEERGFQYKKQSSQYPPIYAISDKNQLLVLDLSKIIQRGKKLTDQTQFLSKNNKQNNQKQKLFYILNQNLISPQKNESIVGAIMKASLIKSTQQKKQDQSLNVTTNSQGERSFFVALDTSDIKVFDQIGNQKDLIMQQSPIDHLYKEINKSGKQLSSINYQKTLQLLNSQPYPYLLSTDWIYSIDLSKQSRQVWSCPHIPKVKKLFIQNIRSNEVFVLAENRIYKVNIKGKDLKNIGKKGLCEIELSIPYFDPLIQNKKAEDISFFVHKNLIFLDNIIFNMTSNRYLTVSSQHSLLGNDIDSGQCSKFELYWFAYSSVKAKKTARQKHSSMIFLCKKELETTLHVFSVIQVKQESSVLIYIILAFILVVLITVWFFRSSGQIDERQFSLQASYSPEERELRRKQREKLNEYMEQAKKIQDERKILKNQKNQQQKLVRKEQYQKGKNRINNGNLKINELA